VLYLGKPLTEEQRAYIYQEYQRGIAPKHIIASFYERFDRVIAPSTISKYGDIEPEIEYTVEPVEEPEEKIPEINRTTEEVKLGKITVDDWRQEKPKEVKLYVIDLENVEQKDLDKILEFNNMPKIKRNYAYCVELMKKAKENGYTHYNVSLGKFEVRENE